MSRWQPITAQELERVVGDQLARCTPTQREAFARHRVPFYRVPIHRLRTVEEVFVVARLPGGLIYYEDVEEGFEIGNVGIDGAFPDCGCSQYELTHVLAQAEL